MSTVEQRIEEISRERRALNALHELCGGDQKAVSDLLWGVVNSMAEAKHNAEEALVEKAFHEPLPLAEFCRQQAAKCGPEPEVEPIILIGRT